jgi:hypothetical protein
MRGFKGRAQALGERSGDSEPFARGNTKNIIIMVAYEKGYNCIKGSEISLPITIFTLVLRQL